MSAIVDPIQQLASMVALARQQRGGAPGDPSNWQGLSPAVPGAQTPTPSALPPTSPVQVPSQPPSAADEALRASSAITSGMAPELVGAHAPSEAMQTLEDIRGLRGKMSTLETPKAGYRIDPSRGFLHNLGQVLGLASTATVPGRAVERAIYQPGLSDYAMHQKNLAEQLAAAQGELAAPKEVMQTSAAAMAAGPRMLSAESSARRAGAAEMHEETRRITEEHLTAYRNRRLALDDRIRSGQLTETQARTSLMAQRNEIEGRWREAEAKLIARGQNLGWSKDVMNEQTNLLKDQWDQEYRSINEHWLMQKIGERPTPGAPPTVPIPSQPAAPPGGGKGSRRVIDLTK